MLSNFCDDELYFLASKEMIINTLDKNCDNYEELLILLEALPNDSIFRVYTDDSVSAVYYDEENKITHHFPLLYSSTAIDDIEYNTHLKSLDDELKTFIDVKTNGELNSLKRILCLIFGTFILLILVILIMFLLLGV